MNKVVLYIAASLDGFIARKNGSIDWLHSFESQGEDYGYPAFLESIGVVVMGSKSYEQAITFGEWPYKNTPSVVVTTRELKGVEGEDITFYDGDLKMLISRLKGQTTKDIWLMGGATLIQSFLKENLVDEIFLFEVPVLLGEGLSLFGSLEKDLKLELVNSKSYKTGIVELHYKLTPHYGSLTKS